MSLSQRVDSDLKEAMRARDTTKLGVLRMLKSALKYAAIAKSGTQAELSDVEAAQVIRKQVKQRQDSIESFEKGGRAELASKEKEELSILNAYLPQVMTAAAWVSINCLRRLPANQSSLIQYARSSAPTLSMELLSLPARIDAMKSTRSCAMKNSKRFDRSFRAESAGRTPCAPGWII